MAKYIYLRVSTQKQSYEQQMQDIINYGVNPDTVDGIVEEKESGGKSYTDRKLQQLLTKCHPGDIVYAASTDRLGRSFVDMVNLMQEAKKRDVYIVACKQNLSLQRNDLSTQLLIAITTIMDEDERMRIKHRIQNAMDYRKEEIAKKGYFVVTTGVNAGMKRTKLGAQKGCDMSNALSASIESKVNSMLAWQESSPAFQWVKEQLQSGRPRAEIIAEFNKLHELMPDKFSTRTGKPMSKGTLSQWASRMNLID